MQDGLVTDEAKGSGKRAQFPERHTNKRLLAELTQNAKTKEAPVAKESSVVKVERYNGISTVIMNRPEKRNAMSPELHLAMDRTLEELETDPDTKVVVIRGAGGNFSAGQDLKEFFRALEDKPANRRRCRKSPTAGAGNGFTTTTSRPSP